jgi:EAL domain-containing protein (putative c-di-GMP-specific phosphodiesterase class I)
MKQILAQIKSLGVRVALDDFGTGYSSLNHIRELPIDVIKIDRCFIEHIADDDFSDAFVKMVSELAVTLSVNICTEGVELTEQYKRVKSLPIKYIQGYYFGKPMKAEAFEDAYL